MNSACAMFAGMLAERLAVIADHDVDHAIVELARAQPRAQPAEGVVGDVDVVGVRVGVGRLGERPRRHARRVVRMVARRSA